MISLYPSFPATERVVDGLKAPRSKAPAEQLLFEGKAGFTVSLRCTETVPFRPPLEVGLAHIAVILFKHERGLEDEIEQGLRVCPLQLGFGLPRDPCDEAWVEVGWVLSKESDEVQVFERVFAGRAGLAATF